ncbi:MAG: iron export ABC transporter permease subunit FetB [Bacteroidetes bacterium HGW-Bacteroidetes-21]|jgi:putative ABC transport system permease protein|nr:MAG: iron export ABC transporter permease subunit FetB [Bacteroidetes bacterium HGW-Bacteroidetes-21]
MDTQDIGWLNLLIGLLILIFPLWILQKYKTGLAKDALISSGRMVLQLLLVGFYLEFLFRINLWWANILWLLVMIVVAAFTMIGRTGLKWRKFLLPNFLALLFTLLFVDVFFLMLVVQMKTVFEARYLIPVSGMILGNAMQNSIIALNDFYNEIKTHPAVYRFSLANGATLRESLKSYYKNALIKSLNPTVAKMAVIGLIALPGTMTGQIIGGSSPVTAIKYQIMLMVVIFAASAISSWLCLILSSRYAFDDMGNLRKGIFYPIKRQKKK